MTDEEIFTLYRDAKHKESQIIILSELAGMTVHEVICLLLEHGYSVRYPVRVPGNKRVEVMTDADYQKFLFRRIDKLNEQSFLIEQELKDIAACMRGYR